MKDKFPVRKKLRMKDYDYSKAEMYFITICLKNRDRLLGKIINDNSIKLTKEEKITEKY